MPSAEKKRIQGFRRDLGANFSTTSNTRVCSAHFLEQDFRRTDGIGLLRLVDGAVPNVFAWSKDKRERRPLKRSRSEPVLAEEIPSKRQISEVQTSQLSSAPDVLVVPPEPDATAGNAGEPARTPHPSLDHDYDDRSCCGAGKKIFELEEEVMQLKQRLVTLESVKDNDR